MPSGIKPTVTWYRNDSMGQPDPRRRLPRNSPVSCPGFSEIASSNAENASLFSAPSSNAINRAQRSLSSAWTAFPTIVSYLSQSQCRASGTQSIINGRAKVVRRKPRTAEERCKETYPNPPDPHGLVTILTKLLPAYPTMPRPTGCPCRSSVSTMWVRDGLQSPRTKTAQKGARRSQRTPLLI